MTGGDPRCGSKARKEGFRQAADISETGDRDECTHAQREHSIDGAASSTSGSANGRTDDCHHDRSKAAGQCRQGWCGGQHQGRQGLQHVVTTEPIDLCSIGGGDCQQDERREPEAGTGDRHAKWHGACAPEQCGHGADDDRCGQGKTEVERHHADAHGSQILRQGRGRAAIVRGHDGASLQPGDGPHQQHRAHRPDNRQQSCDYGPTSAVTPQRDCDGDPGWHQTQHERCPQSDDGESRQRQECNANAAGAAPGPGRDIARDGEHRDTHDEVRETGVEHQGGATQVSEGSEREDGERADNRGPRPGASTAARDARGEVTGDPGKRGDGRGKGHGRPLQVRPQQGYAVNTLTG